MTIDTRNTNNTNLRLATIIAIPAFIIAPFLFTFTWAYLAVTQKKESISHAHNSLIIFLSAYVGLLHASREIIGDQFEYLYFFEIARETDFNSYMNIFPDRDYLFWIGTYLISNTWFLDSRFYFFLLGFLGVFALLKATQLIANNFKLAPAILIAILVMIAFSADIFVWSMHLVRQNLAFSVAVLSLALLYTKKGFLGGAVIFGLIAVLIHTASLFILSVGYAIFAAQKTTLQRIIGVIALIIVYFNFNLIINFIDMQSSYMLDRGIRGADGTNINSRDWLLPQVAGLVMMAFAGGLLLFVKNKSIIYPYAGFIIIYISFSFLVISDNELQLLSYRLLITIYFLLPFFIPLAMFAILSTNIGATPKLAESGFLLFSFVWVLRFFYTVGGEYGYPGALFLITNPLFSLAFA